MPAFPFQFPFAPYGIQVEFMQTLYSVLDNDQIGIFSSPTGTGKSLSLLCGTLKWLTDYRQTLESHEILNEEALERQINSTSSLQDEPDWVKAFAKRKLSEDRRNQLATVSALQDRKVKYSKGLSTAADEDHLVKLRKMSGYESDDDDFGGRPVRTTKTVQVIYASRTHSQLNQFIDELKKTMYPDAYEIRTVSLGSRKQLCLNASVQKLQSLNAMNDRCKDLKTTRSCPYLEGDLEMFIDKSLSKVADIEDLTMNGKTAHYCSYYGTRHLLPYVDIVTVPYSILLSNNTRKSLGITLENSVVIVDEAHNLIDAISQVYAVELSSASIDISIQCLNDYFKKYSERFSGENTVHLKQTVKFLKCLRSCDSHVKVDQSAIYPVVDFLSKIRADNLNLFNLSRFFDDSDICRKSQKFVPVEVVNNSEQYEQSASSSPLYKIKEFIQALILQEDNARILVSASADGNVRLKYMLLNPGEPFEDIVNSCKSLILAGGTMEPLDEVFCHLFPNAAQERIKVFNCEHVVPKDNLMMITLGSGTDNQMFDFNYQKRNGTKLINELGRSLEMMARVSPAGMVVFFPSFDYLDKVIAVWKTVSLLSELNAIKKIFNEPRLAKDVPSTLAAYENQLSEGNGAIMFCVVGGKLSEGINFSDGLARVVCVVGLPFPNIKSPELVKKMEYLDEVVAKYRTSTDQPSGPKPITSQDYYENLCMKAVNQSIGRAIRHQNDYAAIVLLDHRFARPNITAKLPTWMKKSLVSGKHSINSVAEKLELFFASKNKQV